MLMCIQKMLIDNYLTELFDNEKEMIAAIETIISHFEGKQIQSKIFLRKIKLHPSEELSLDTGFFSDTLTIHGPIKDEENLLSSFLPAVQQSKIRTLLLLFTTLKPKYREELLLKIRKKL